MTDLPDDFRSRLPDADRIRDRIRDRRDADGDGPGDNEPEGYYEYQLKNLKGGDDADKAYDLNPNDVSWKVEEGEGLKAGDTSKVVDHKADDLKLADTSKVVDHKADDLKLADTSKVVDHKADDLKLADTSKVVDHKADDLKLGDTGKVVGHKADDLKLADDITGSKVVDHTADDVAWKVEEGESWKVEEGESWKVEEGESWKVEEGVNYGDAGTTVDGYDLSDTKGLGLDELAKADTPVDPVGDALAPLGDDDQYQAMPELDASVDASSPMLGDDDGDGAGV